MSVCWRESGLVWSGQPVWLNPFHYIHFYSELIRILDICRLKLCCKCKSRVLFSFLMLIRCLTYIHLTLIIIWIHNWVYAFICCWRIAIANASETSCNCANECLNANLTQNSCSNWLWHSLMALHDILAGEKVLRMTHVSLKNELQWLSEAQISWNASSARWITTSERQWIEQRPSQSLSPS